MAKKAFSEIKGGSSIIGDVIVSLSEDEHGRWKACKSDDPGAVVRHFTFTIRLDRVLDVMAARVLNNFPERYAMALEAGVTMDLMPKFTPKKGAEKP